MTAALYIGLSGASWGGGTVDIDELEPPGTPTPGPRTPAAGGVS